MAKKNDGRKFEDMIHGHLKELQVSQPVVVHRFYDTKSARVNYLPAQPGDFLAVQNGKSTLIEAKSSKVHSSLASCAANIIKPGQIGQHKKWLRGGASCLFVFWSMSEGIFEIWDSNYVVKKRSDGKRLDRDRALYFEDPEDFLLSLEGRIRRGQWIR